MTPRPVLAALFALSTLPGALLPTLLAAAAPARATAPAAPSPQDRGFVQQFLRASLAAREAGALAAGRGEDPGVRAYGATLLRRHEASEQELQALAVTLPLAPLPDEPDGDQKAMLDELLQSPGPDFDRLFLSRLLAAQEDLVKVVSIQAATGDQPALRGFAQRQLPVLQDLVQRARALATDVGMPPLSASP
jgi:putative membrane protein